MDRRIAYVALVLGVVLCLGMFALADCEIPKYGGVLKVAVSSTFVTLDCSMTSSEQPANVGIQIFEALTEFFSGDKSVRPMLADSWEIFDNGTKYVFRLRQGVYFHNGTEMTAQDVAASIERWINFGARGNNVKPYFDHTATPDDYTFELYLTQEYAPLLSLLGFVNGGPIIVPASVVEKAGDQMMEPDDCIGTGPYKFAEWIPGQYVAVERWDRYTSRSDKPDGHAGGKTAYFDRIEWYIVPEAQARLIGVQIGDYHISQGLPNDLYDIAVSDPAVMVFKAEPPSFCQVMFNTKEGVMSNVLMRRAVQATLDMSEILPPAFGDLQKLEGTYFPQGSGWYSTAGLDKYNQANPVLGMQLAQQAGYQGEPIVLLALPPGVANNSLSEVVTKQLNDAGFTVTMQVYDLASWVSKRREPDQWDLFCTLGSATYYDPSMSYWLSPSYPGWWDNPEKQAIMSEFLKHSGDHAARLAIWDQMQQLIYDEVPIQIIGSHYRIDTLNARLLCNVNSAEHPWMLQAYYWNMWFK